MMRAIAIQPGPWRRIVLVATLLVAIWLLSVGGAAAADPWTGEVATDGSNVRSAPNQSAPVVGTLSAGDSIEITTWVEGETVTGTNNMWGEIAPGQYVYSANLIKPKPDAPPKPETTLSGRWIDLNLTQQVITAYEGDTPVYWAVTSTGKPGWETPTGTFTIGRRVANETMDSSTLAVVAGDPYRLTNVYDTQYFTQWGHSLHYNYWKWDSPFGVPTSHGCAGLEREDSQYFWNFASTGTPLVIHD